MALQSVTTSRKLSFYAELGSECMPSESTRRRDAVSEPTYKNGDGFTPCSLPSLPKLIAMLIAEGVKPHQKLSAAGTMLRSRHGWLYGVSPSPTMSYLTHSKGVSVCPLKPYTAGMRCRSPHGWVYGVFQRAQQSRTKSQA